MSTPVKGYEVFISKLKCSGKTKNNIITPFKDVMKFAKKHKLIEYNPFDDVDSIKLEASKFVFLNKFGRHIHNHSVNIHVFKPTLEKAGLATNRSCKDTRASYITNSLDNNERMGFIQKQVGHSTTKMIVDC